MKSSNIMLLSFLLIVISTSQILPLQTPTKVFIENGENAVFNIDIPSEVTNTTNFIITATPIVLIPSQIPNIVLSSTNFTQQCMKDSNQLEGICIISHENLVGFSGQNIIITASCTEKCQFRIEAYLSSTVQIIPNNIYTISPSSENIFPFMIQITNLTFDSIEIEAIFEKQSQQQGGVQMFANIGNKDEIMPRQQIYQYKAISIKKGLGISIRKEELTVGSWIKIGIYTQLTSIIDFSVVTVDNDKKMMVFGRDEQCFLSRNEEKLYILDFSKSNGQFQEYELNLAATIYSGTPIIEVSFKKDFSNILQNYGVSGNLNYLISKKIREQNGFIDKIYIKISSINSAFLILKTSFNPLDYIYVQQATTYLSFFDSQDVQNYIFDVYYTLKQGETVEKNLFFTVKIKVLNGFGEYASRICNKQSNQACILHNRQELFSDEFMREAADLPGSILQYYSLYEIYMYAKVKQCKNVPLKNEKNRYLCKIHMAGYNPNRYGQLQWAITSYSRLNNILLVEGHPFKDLVYEDSYNYYSFIVPEEFQQITIFVTTLNGEITLITSQKYQNPEIIFSYMEGNDIRSNPLNSIKYAKTQVFGLIYIGVYGASMSEFMVNVVVKRKEEESRAIVLVQNIQQIMHSEKGEILNFKLNIKEEAQWTVQVIEIYGQIGNKLISQNNTIVCNSFSICRFNSSTSMKLLINSSKQSKFTLIFYKKSSCRLLQVGSTHFLDIQANTSQYIQFMVSSKDTIISYSQNLMHKMMMHSISLSVKINQNDLGKMEQHYSHLSQAEMAQFCKKMGNGTKESSCIMRIEVIGCKEENVEAEISVFTVDEPIPLYDGVQFVYANNQVKQSKPAYFSYYALTEDKITLLVKSQSSFGYVLAYTWVEYEDYRQVQNYSQIYVPNPASIDNINSFKIGPYQKNFKINMDDKKSDCQECILLISVFPNSTAKLVSFSIEITALEKTIKVGQTIDGLIEKDEFYMYQLQKIQGQSDAVISFSNYRSGNECYRVSLIHKGTQKQVLFQGNEVILQKGKQYYAIITGQAASCKYSISLWQSDLPVKIMQTGYFYSISLNKSSKLYFVYYHSDSNAFHFFESIKSGSIYSYATPIKGTIRKTIEDDIFLYKSQSIYDSIDITPDLSDFCSGCYYLIKIVGEPSVQGSIGVVDSNTYPFLVEGQVVRERVNRGEVRRFSYYTFDKFRLKLNIIYGEIQLIYTNIVSSSKQLYTISSDLQLDLDAGSNQYLLAGYEFTLTMMQQTTYSLQIISEDKVRILQGYPLDHYFEANQSVSFDYNQVNKKDFNLQIIMSEWEMNLVIQLQVSTKQDSKFKLIASKHIGNIFSYDIRGSTTEYHFKITASKSIDLKLLITRQKLTYLQPNSPILASKPTTYQIFTEGKVTMMQIFSCKGDVEVIASARYSDIQNSTSNAVTLQHSNIGGHYVIQSQEGQAEFFITVQNKTEEEPLFLVEYSMVQILPYKYFTNVDESISYKVQKDSVELQIQLPQLKEKIRYLKNINAVLKVFATSQRKSRDSLGQCGNDLSVFEDSIKITQFNNNNEKSFTVSIPQKQLISYGKQQQQPLFIRLIVRIIFEEEQELRKLTYIYQSIQVYLSQSNLAVEEESSDVKFVIVWMVLPLAIGAAIALLALKYCLKRWHLLSHDNGSELVEEEQSKNPPSEELSQKTALDQATLQEMRKQKR